MMNRQCDSKRARKTLKRQRKAKGSHQNTTKPVISSSRRLVRHNLVTFCGFITFLAVFSITTLLLF